MMNWLRDILFPVIIATLAFITEDVLKNYYIEPNIEYRKLLGEISFYLEYYRNIYANIDERINNNIRISDDRIEAGNKFRELGCRLSIVSGKNRFSHIKTSSSKIKIASGNLILLSNSLGPDKDAISVSNHNIKVADDIHSLLSL